MRVYLDYQIWDYISKNDDIKKYFEKQKVDKNGAIISVLLI